MTRTITLNLTKTITGTITIQDEAEQTEYITNGDFSNGMTDWTNPLDPESHGDTTVVDGKASSAQAGNLYQIITPLTQGQQYTIRCDVVSSGTRGVRFNFATVDPAPYASQQVPEAPDKLTTGSHAVTFTATEAGLAELAIDLGSSAEPSTITIDNISILPA